MDIVAYLKESEKYTKLGARLPKGVLLVGPPGIGTQILWILVENNKQNDLQVKHSQLELLLVKLVFRFFIHPVQNLMKCLLAQVLVVYVNYSVRLFFLII